MQVLKETTKWDTPNHTYFIDRYKLVGYIKAGTDKIIKCRPTNFDQRYRTFEKLNWNDFKGAFGE